MAQADIDRQQLLQEIGRAGREHSTATVLFHSAVSERMGLGVTDMKTLDFLARLGALTPKEIRERTGLATASVTDLIDRLEQKGFVRRERDSRDRRRVLVTIAMEREAEYFHLFQSFGEALGKLLAIYSDDELRTINDFLQRMSEIARAEALKLRSGEAR